MRLRQHHAVFAGIAFLSAGAAVLEDAFSRLFAVVGILPRWPFAVGWAR